MKPILLLALCATAITSTNVNAATYLIGADSQPRVVDGRLVTDGYSDATGAFEWNVKHFGYQLGLTPNNPYFTGDPGFNAVVGSGLPQGQQLRFDIVRHLTRWDGTAGPVAFGSVPNAETLRLSLGAAETIVSGAGDAVTGFSLGNIAAGGAIHKHLTARLRGGTDALAAPSNGLYFTALRLSVTGGSVVRSDAIYIAYNLGLSSADFNRGMAYLANPLPGDANFDSHVDFADLVILAQHYNQTDTSYFNADFNGDRVVNFGDLVTLAQNYNTSALGTDWARAQALAGIVPEPTAAIAMLTGTAVARRRRRSV